MRIRSETPDDITAIRALTARAFAGHPHSDGSEPAIIDRLRLADALTLSLVAEQDGAPVGHLALSPVDWEGGHGWFGLGPVSVDPSHQGKGIGSALIRQALEHLQAAGFSGCVVAGDPA